MSEYVVRDEVKNSIYTLQTLYNKSGWSKKKLILNSSEIGIKKVLSMEIGEDNGYVYIGIESDWCTLTEEEINKIFNYLNNIPKEQINESTDKYLNLLISEIIARKDYEYVTPIVRMVHYNSFYGEYYDDKHAKIDDNIVINLIKHQSKFKELINTTNYISVNCLDTKWFSNFKN